MKRFRNSVVLALAVFGATPALAQDRFGPKTVIPAGVELTDARTLAADLVIERGSDSVLARFTDGTSERLQVLHCGVMGLPGAMPLLFKQSQKPVCPSNLTPLK